MYKLTISNEKLSTTEEVYDFEGVMQLVKVFTKHYGEPIFMQVLSLNKKKKEVDSN